MRSQSPTILNAVASAAPIGLAVVDADMRFQGANYRFAEMSGLSPEELHGMPVDKVFPDIGAELLAMLRECQMTGQAVGDVELNYRRASDGEELSVAVGFFRVGDRSEGDGVFGCSLIDVRGLKALEVELSRTSAMIEALVREAPVGIGFLDRDLRYLHVNQTMAEMNGRSVAEHIGHTVHEVVPELAEQLEPVMRGVVETGEVVVDMEASGARRSSGRGDTHWLQTIYRVDTGSENVGIGTVVRDVTERHRLVDQLESMATLAGALSASVGTDEVVKVLLTHGRRALSADLVEVGLLSTESDVVQVAASNSLGPEAPVVWEELSLDADNPIAEAVRSGEMQIGVDRTEVPSGPADPITTIAGATVAVRDGDQRIFGAIRAGWAQEEITSTKKARLVTVAQLGAPTLERSRLADVRRDFMSMLQAELLPSVPTIEQVDIAVDYRASTTGLGFGGDWYDVIPIDAARTVLVVGDVAGHGIGAAVQMSQVRGVLNALIESGIGLEDLFSTAMAPLARLGYMFLGTAVVAMIDLETEQLRYVCAGHPPPLLVPVDGPARMLEQCRLPALGLPCKRIDCTVEPFEAGSSLILYTDGLVERRGEIIDKGFDRLLRVVDDIEARQAQEVIGQMVGAMVDSAPLRDDIAAVVAVHR